MLLFLFLKRNTLVLSLFETVLLKKNIEEMAVHLRTKDFHLKSALALKLVSTL